MLSRGDKLYLGNRHFRLTPDARTCVLRIYGREIRLELPAMTGNTGEVLRQAAGLAADKKINLTFKLDGKRLHMTVDYNDLSKHPQRRRPVAGLPGRCLGIDLNPNWIGITAGENRDDPTSLGATTLLEHVLVKLDLAVNASPELVRETLAVVANRAISMARIHRCVTIALEKGLGKLRSSGKNRSLNRLLNYWARTIFVAMLTRRARLAGIDFIEVWAGYSSTIGNLAFDAPVACASATEITRRGITRLANVKDVLPTFGEGWSASLRKDLPLPSEAGTWADVHRKIKGRRLATAARIPTRRPALGFPMPGDANVPRACGRPPWQTSSTGTVVPGGVSEDKRSNPKFGHSTWRYAVRQCFHTKIRIAEVAKQITLVRSEVVFRFSIEASSLQESRWDSNGAPAYRIKMR